MNHYCTPHQTPLTQGVSKTKFNEDGSAKTYWYHMIGKEMCFGDKTPKPQGSNTSAPTPIREEQIEKVGEALGLGKDTDETSGKIRHGIVVAWVEKEGLKVLGMQEKLVINELVDFIKTGK